MATKIMYLLDYYEGPQAGTEGQLLQLLQHHDRSRYEPAMTLLRISDYIERNPLCCPVKVLGITRLASVRSIFKVLRFALSLRREGYRLVHCFFNDVSLIAPPLLRMFGMRVLVSRRDMGFWYTPGKLAVLRLVSAFVDRYVANCQAVGRVVHQREWAPSRKISVIYNGILPPASDRGGASHTIDLPGQPDQSPVVGIVANLKPIKRIDVLIRALAVACECYPSARLIVVGKDGPSQQGRNMREELEGLASLLGIRNKVIFTGGVDDPAPYIKRFTVAVLCSESEGFSNALIEYMQAGRPIICTDTGGNPELVQDGINGFLFPVGDVDTLADRLIKLLSDSALARRLGEAARETVLSTYSHTRMIIEQMACYDEVLSGSRSNRRFKRVLGTAR
jgi:glycosyltransferase involved in cell wall biosynthesis